MPDQLDIVALEATNSLDFVEKVFSLYKSGEVFAVCRPGITIEDYKTIKVKSWLRSTPGNGWMKADHIPRYDSNPAQITFSSGTEGRPKAILISSAALSDVEDRLLKAMKITSEIREYIGVPVTYSFGLGRARVVSRAGGSFYLPERFDPIEIRDMLESGQINAISAVPSLFRLLLSRPDVIGDLGARVQWIEIGSQYMSDDEKREMCRLFPNARIVQHYGLTEASRSTFLILNETPDARMESVGKPDPSAIKIGSEGEICIRGKHLALGVLHEDKGLEEIVSGDGWLHTKDRGRIEDGWLYYLGRLDNQINLAGVKVAAEALERRVAELVNVAGAHFAVTSVPDAIRGEAVLIAFDAVATPYAHLLEAALETALAEQGIDARRQIRTIAVDELPKTGSGKIRHSALREAWATSGEDATKPEPGSPRLDRDQERIAEVWRSVLGPVRLDPDSTFYDVGGDSLGAMQIGLAMETRFSPAVVQATIRGLTLREIAGRLSEEGRSSADQKPGKEIADLPPKAVESWALNITRGVMVISVLASHWAPGVWKRIAPQLSNDPLSIFYTMGTPGFAIVFGIGVGYLMLPGYRDNKKSVGKRIKFSLRMVLLAYLALATMHISISISSGTGLTGREVGEAFYNILGFYTLALLSLPLWLKLLSRNRNIVLAFGIPASLAVWHILTVALGSDQLESPAEGLRLMLVARYSYFHVFPLVLAGVFVGYQMARIPDAGSFARSTSLWGAVIIGFSILASLEVYGPGFLLDRQSEFLITTWSALMYFGIVCLVLGLSILSLENWKGMSGAPRAAFRFLILTGNLALPIYAFHQLVIPSKNLLVLSGLNPTVALAVPMALFLLVIGYGMLRLYRMYF